MSLYYNICMEDLESDRKKLQAIIDLSKNIVFFSGAGVSTESGIPDFRSVDGLYNQKYKYPPELIISHSFYERNTEEFYRFYRDKMLVLDVKCNPCHLYLKKLEDKGKLKAIVTQNIDGLHTLAGNKNVIELHGSIHRNYCQKCMKLFSGEYIKNSKEIIPHCDKCGGIIKPDVVLYEEPLDELTITKTMVAIREADTLIVAGTSLIVYPAASFVSYFQGKNFVYIDKNEEAKNAMANLIIHQKVGELFSLLEV